MSVVDDYRSTAKATITGIDRTNAQGVEVKATNIATNQTINGTVNLQTKEATFSNLSVALDKLNEKYNLEVKWGKAGYELTEKVPVTVDNRAAPVWTTIPDVSLNQGQTKTINLKDYLTQFGEQTLFVTDGTFPAGVTLKDGVLTISSSALPQDKTVITKRV